MLPRVLEPEVMDSAEEARDYDSMDHAQVNRAFVADLIAFWKPSGRILDLGTGTALIPIELCRQVTDVSVVAIDAAHHMLAAAKANVERAGFKGRILPQHSDAKGLAFPDATFDGVISNSIVHHIPEPLAVLKQIARVVKPGGAIIIRDLLRPPTDATVKHLVKTYAGDANAHQQKMFEDSLRAALTLEEIRKLIKEVGFNPDEVRQNSDRHWTWAAKKRE